MDMYMYVYDVGSCAKRQALRSSLPTSRAQAALPPLSPRRNYVNTKRPMLAIDTEAALHARTAVPMQKVVSTPLTTTQEKKKENTWLCLLLLSTRLNLAGIAQSRTPVRHEDTPAHREEQPNSRRPGNQFYQPADSRYP